MIPYGRQDIRAEDVEAVLDILRSDFLTQGPRVPDFERAVADRVGAGHAVAVNSATSALHIACDALGLGPGDRLWTSPITFVASANCGLYCGAWVDFVDIDPGTFNICPDRLAQKLDTAAASGTLPKVLVVVHMCGQPADMPAIGALARRYGIRVIEDASHAVGAVQGGRAVGAGVHSDVTVFSFHPVKIITTAEGGMALTNDAALAERMARTRSHGVTRDPAMMSGALEGAWVYEQVELGWNYRMPDLLAALGLSQLSRLDAYIAARNRLADRYDQLLADLALDVPARAADVTSAFHLYVVRLHDPARRRAVFDRLRADGIGVNVHYIPVHLQPFYRARGHRPGDFPAAEAYYARAITIPLFPDLSADQQDTVVARLGEALAP